MRILITGNLGYVGSCLVQQLRSTWPGARLIGLDANFYSSERDCSSAGEDWVDQQVIGDIRDLPSGLLAGVDAIVHLAALSSDSLGRDYEPVVNEINYRASLELARRAKKAGVKAFVFASSCRVYGRGEDAARTEKSDVNPTSAYKRTKIAVEYGLKTLGGRDFTVTCLRFASACGVSSRMRVDATLNDCVASAVSKSAIRVAGNPAAWLQLIHVRDMARAIDWALARPAANGGSYLTLNTGSDAWTWRVGELAKRVAGEIPGTELLMNREPAPADGSYQADFGLFRRLAPLHQPREKLLPSIEEMKLFFQDYLKARGKESSRLSRLRTMAELVAKGQLNSDLTWVEPPIADPDAASRQMALVNAE